MRSIVFAAGGTGGHVIPAQTLAENFSDYGARCEFLACGLSKNHCFDKMKWSYTDVSAAPISASLTGALRFVVKNSSGFVQSVRYFRKSPPAAVVGFGSYHVVPVLAAAVVLRIPLFLYEANAVPGRVIRLFSPFARFTGCYFQNAMQLLRGKTMLVQPLLRKAVQERVPRDIAKNHYNLPTTGKTVLVIGGSLGASVLNSVIPAAISLLPHKPSVLHLAGRLADCQAICDAYEKRGIRAVVRGFEDNMQYAYSAADVVISRSGASAVAEIEERSLPVVYIPYQLAMDNHQKKNAEIGAQRENVVVLDEATLDQMVVSKVLGNLIEKDPLSINISPNTSSRNCLGEVIWNELRGII